MSTTVTQDYTQTGGIEDVVEVLNGVDRATERTILMHLKFKIQNLRKKLKRECLFLRILLHLIIVRFSELFANVKMKIYYYHLKVSSDEVKEIVFKNMSTRMVETFKEEMEYMGPVRLRDVEEAQSRIVAIIRRLEDAGEIVIARGGGDDIIV